MSLLQLLMGSLLGNCTCCVMSVDPQPALSLRLYTYNILMLLGRL
jgi:hypothetical protein